MENASQLNWDDFRILSVVIATKSLTSAARQLGIDPATVSRRMSRLSDTLGIPVYSKHTDGWRPNPDLLEFMALIENFGHDLDKIVSQIKSNQTLPGGSISVRAPACVVTNILLPNFETLNATAPDLRVTFHRTTNASGLGQNDLVVTSIRPEQGRLMVQAVGQMTLEAFAPKDVSPDRFGNWIAGAETEEPFSVETLGKRLFGSPPTHSLDTFADAIRMMMSSGGATIVPRILARQYSADLQRLAPDRCLRVPLYLCYHESRKTDPTIRAVTEWIKTTFKHEGSLCRKTFPDEG